MKTIHYILIKIIQSRANVDSLIDTGYEYSQISMLINEIKKLKYIKILDGQILITERGEKALKDYYTNKKSNYEWIQPQKQHQIPKIEKYDIILPSKK